MINTNSDPDFYLPSSYSLPTLHRHNQNPRKKRSKMIKIEPLMASSSVATTNSGNASSSGVSKPKYYGKKPDPSAPKITRPCSECGKKFWSWKALFGHMRCHPERQWRGINPPPNYRKPISPIQELGSKEAEPALTAEDHEVASCLILLANSDDGGGDVVETTQCGFECSSCKKVFGSHQALGGHRASHKNVKGCFANTTRSTEDVVVVEDCSTDQSVEVKSKMLMVLGHKCSICLRVFSSGQALGGHKRCHWEKGEETTSSSPLMNNQGFNVFAGNEGFGGLDLNLPAPVEDDQSFSSCSSALTSPPSLALDLRLGL